MIFYIWYVNYFYTMMVLRRIVIIIRRTAVSLYRTLPLRFNFLQPFFLDKLDMTSQLKTLISFLQP